jgi:salicylate hydroxylase
MTMPVPTISLNVIIIGGGIAGLTTAYCLGRSGHRITILEQAPWLEEVGAGIQLASNASRLLVRWGLGSALDGIGVTPDAASFNRFENDEKIGFNYIGERVKIEHGAPYYHIHRADLVGMIYELGKKYITIKQDKVVKVLPGAPLASRCPSVVLESGETIEADMIIGADGVKSIARKCVVDGTDVAIPTGDMAYRATIRSEQMEGNEDLLTLLNHTEVTCWMGPGRHIVGYFVRNKNLYNLVMIRPDMDAEESWTASATNEEIRESFQGWNSRVTKLMTLVDGVKKSKLVVRAPLRTWVDTSGRIALLGDSCHAMLPYLAQGAAMAIEDAAVLGRLFSVISDKSQIPELLKGYEELRMPRATATQQASQANQGRFHLPDGPLQQARDTAMKEAMKITLGESSLTDRASSGNQSIVLDHNKNLAAIQFDYDAEAEADKWLRDRGRA